MSSAHTKVNIDELEDAASANGLDHRWEARVAREPLGAAETGVTHFRLKPGKRSPFAYLLQRLGQIAALPFLPLFFALGLVGRAGGGASGLAPGSASRYR